MGRIIQFVNVSIEGEFIINSPQFNWCIFIAAITSKKRDIPLQFWIIFFGVVTVALVAALAGLIFMLCECQDKMSFKLFINLFKTPSRQPLPAEEAGEPPP